MKKIILKDVLIFLLSTVFICSFTIELYAQDDIQELVERYKQELQKIQSSEDSKEFFITHLKDDFGLTNSLMGFINGLENGAYTKQIEYVMNVPVQKWNPNAGAGGWGRYERRNAIRIVNKNVSGTQTNVTSLMSNIGDALAIFSIANDALQAFYGDDNAKLKAMAGMYSFVAGKLTSDFPGMSTAMFGVAIISYALNKFISTALDTYNQFWWERYRNYLLEKYPSFVEDWAPIITQEGGEEILNNRLYEYWSSDEQYQNLQDAPVHVYLKNSEYAKNMFADAFAAQYYRDYLHRNVKAWVQTRLEQGLIEVEDKYQSSSIEIRNLVNEIEILRELVRIAEEEMAKGEPNSLTIRPETVDLEVGQTIKFSASVTFEDGSTSNITESDEAIWSTGGFEYNATNTGEDEVTVTYKGLSATATITVNEKTPVSITVSPSETTAEIGETVKFTLLAVFEDGSTQTISNFEGNSFNAIESGSFQVPITYRGLSTTATVNVEEGSIQCKAPSEILDKETGRCACNTAEGYEMNDDLGKCINIDEAIDEVTEEGGELCDEEALAANLARLDELVASGNRIAANFRATLNKFMKEVNDQNSNICDNNIIAAAYSGAQDQQARYQLLAEEATSLSTDLILEGSLCPLEQIEIDINSILQKVSQLGQPQGQIEDGLVMMENQLDTFGCDDQEVEDQGDTIVERTDPEVIQAGGTGATESCGDGIDNDGNGLIDDGCEGQSNFNVTISIFDSGSRKDDIFGLSVTGQGNLGNTPEGGLRVYPLRLAPGSYTATLTVIQTIYGDGTYTIRIREGQQEIIQPVESAAPEGATVNVSFTVGGNPNASAETESILPMLMNSPAEVRQRESGNN